MTAALANETVPATSRERNSLFAEPVVSLCKGEMQAGTAIDAGIRFVFFIYFLMLLMVKGTIRFGSADQETQNMVTLINGLLCIL
jgi:hypothetical protein